MNYVTERDEFLLRFRDFAVVIIVIVTDFIRVVVILSIFLCCGDKLSFGVSAFLLSGFFLLILMIFFIYCGFYIGTDKRISCSSFLKVSLLLWSLCNLRVLFSILSLSTHFIGNICTFESSVTFSAGTKRSCCCFSFSSSFFFLLFLLLSLFFGLSSLFL